MFVFFVFLLWGSMVIYEDTFIEIFYTQKAIKVCGFKKLLGRLRIRKTSKGKNYM